VAAEELIASLVSPDLCCWAQDKDAFRYYRPPPRLVGVEFWFSVDLPVAVVGLWSGSFFAHRFRFGFLCLPFGSLRRRLWRLGPTRFLFAVRSLSSARSMEVLL
jgi:hypothetical protein